MKAPAIQVPVTIFLDLVRMYKTQPQEVLSRSTYLEADQLERRAYRKLKEHLKKAQP